MVKKFVFVSKKPRKKLSKKISELAALLNKWSTQGIPVCNNCVIFFSNEKLHYNRVGQQFFNAPYKRVTFSL